MSFTFFTDRDLGKKFPSILREGGLSVVRHDDHFSPRASDEEWLGHCGQLGWVALTHNKRIRYVENEREAVMRNGVALLVMVGVATNADLAESFLLTFPKVERFLTEHTPPFIAKIYRATPKERESNDQASGRIELWYP